MRIEGIRSDADEPGLREYEISFLRLLETVSSGAAFEISYTGTTLVYRPGVLTGGKHSHSCNGRGVGYFLEPLVALAPFGKNPMALTLTGVTNDNVDTSVDALRTVLLPILPLFGVSEGVGLKIISRGAAPLGGGKVLFTCGVVRQLSPLQRVNPGRVAKIRGIAWSTRVSPAMANRVMDASRSVLTRFIPDVFVFTDVFKGPDSGLSPGYGLTLVASSSTGAAYSAELMFQPVTRTNDDGPQPQTPDVAAVSAQLHEKLSNITTPEDLGHQTALALLQQLTHRSFIPAIAQWLAVLFMVLCPEDVSRILLGRLKDFTIQFLRDIHSVYGVRFKIIPNDPSTTASASQSPNLDMNTDNNEGTKNGEKGSDGDSVVEEAGENQIMDDLIGDGVLLSCVGTGYINVSKRTI